MRDSSGADTARDETGKDGNMSINWKDDFIETALYIIPLLLYVGMFVFLFINPTIAMIILLVSIAYAVVGSIVALILNYLGY